MSEVVVPLYQSAGADFDSPWIGTSGSGYIQYGGWVPFDSSLTGYVALHGARPAMDSVDEDTTYLEVSSPTAAPPEANDIWPGVYFAAWAPTATIVAARLEIEARTDPAARLYWGISGNQFYYTNAPTGDEPGDAVAGAGWHLYQIPVLDETVSTRTVAKLVADLADGVLMAGVHFSAPFDLSTLRLVITYADTISWVRQRQRGDGYGTGPKRARSYTSIRQRGIQ